MEPTNVFGRQMQPGEPLYELQQKLLEAQDWRAMSVVEAVFMILIAVSVPWFATTQLFSLNKTFNVLIDNNAALIAGHNLCASYDPLDEWALPRNALG